MGAIRRMPLSWCYVLVNSIIWKSDAQNVGCTYMNASAMLDFCRFYVLSSVDHHVCEQLIDRKEEAWSWSFNFNLSRQKWGRLDDDRWTPIVAQSTDQLLRKCGFVIWWEERLSQSRWWTEFREWRWMEKLKSCGKLAAEVWWDCIIGILMTRVP